MTDPNSWQPLQYTDGTGTFVTQGFLGAQWTNVTPFALTSSGQYRSTFTPPYTFGSAGYTSQSLDLVKISASLTDTQKVIAEYWKDGPHSETPPGHWCLHAQYVSTRDNHTLNQDVKMFFALTNAVFDASIVAWDAKRNWDSVRPATAIPYLFTGTKLKMWGGPRWAPFFKTAHSAFLINLPISRPPHFLNSYPGTARLADRLPKY